MRGSNDTHRIVICVVQEHHCLSYAGPDCQDYYAADLRKLAPVLRELPSPSSGRWTHRRSCNPMTGGARVVLTLKIGTELRPGFGQRRVAFQTHLFALHAAPEPFDENIVHATRPPPSMLILM